MAPQHFSIEKPQKFQLIFQHIFLLSCLSSLDRLPTHRWFDSVPMRRMDDQELWWGRRRSSHQSWTAAWLKFQKIFCLFDDFFFFRLFLCIRGYMWWCYQFEIYISSSWKCLRSKRSMEFDRHTNCSIIITFLSGLWLLPISLLIHSFITNIKRRNRAG